jgi:hypothetical protein
MRWLNLDRLFNNHRSLTDPGEIAERITTVLPRIGGGSLRFWGQWFGKPYDNCHGLVACEAEPDLVRLHFNENEVLSIWRPRGIAFEERPYVPTGSWKSPRQFKEHFFRVLDADRVRWEWFSYGHPQTDERRDFLDFVRTAGGIEATSLTPRTVRPDANAPAVEYISIS